MIQQLGNAFITLMLARFMLNDVPHYAGLLASPGEKPATFGQLRYIAVLTQRLHIVEMRVESYGEAGRMIRELEEEDKHRKRLTKGSSSSLVVRRSTVDKEIDALDEAYRRTASDMRPKMQSAHQILGDIIGHHYEEPVVIVQENGKVVGAATYRTHDNYDTGERETYIAELASLVDKPGIGRLLVEEVIKIAREENADLVVLSHGPGARGFYEKLGFAMDPRDPKTTIMMLRLKKGGGNPGRLSEAGFKALPIAYRGFDPEKPEPDIIHVTPDESVAKTHGRYVMTGKVLPDKLIPDPEIEGFEARKLTGIESFKLGSARIPAGHFYPDDYRRYMESGGNPGNGLTLYGLLGDHGITDGKYHLYHITPDSNMPNIWWKGLVPPVSPEEQLFGPYSPTGEKRYVRGVYLITEEIHVPTFLEEFIESSDFKGELVVLRVSLPIVWEVEPDPESLSMGGTPTAVISHITIPPHLIEIYERKWA